MEFYSGIIEGKNVVVVRSGIGKVNAAVCTQILIDDFKAEVVINTGIAGSLNADINIGDIVVSTDLIHHDMNAVAFGYPVGQIPQMEAFSFHSDDALRSAGSRAQFQTDTPHSERHSGLKRTLEKILHRML